MKSDPIHQQRAQDAKTRGTMAQDAATRRLATAADGARRAGWDAAREPSETASQDGRGLEAVLQAKSEERAAEITRGSERATPPCSDQALTPGEGIDIHDTSTLLTHFGTFEGGEIMVCDGLGCVGGAADITPWSPTTHAKVVDSATNLRLRGGGSTYTRRTQ